MEETESREHLENQVDEVKALQWHAVNQQKAFLTKQEALSKTQNRIGTIQIQKEVEGKQELVPKTQLIQEQNKLMSEQRNLSDEQSGCSVDLRKLNDEIHYHQARLLSLITRLRTQKSNKNEDVSNTTTNCDDAMDTASKVRSDLENALKNPATCDLLLNSLDLFSGSTLDDIASLSKFITMEAPNMPRETLRAHLISRGHHMRHTAQLYLQLADRFVEAGTSI